MFDFRLKVFYTVARRQSFTRAAEELFITQPAVTKHIHEIEAYCKVQLFTRNGTRISLTPAGETMLAYTEKIFALYHDLEAELILNKKSFKGTLKIGASTTVAQYVLPACLASLRSKFSELKVELYSGNTEHIENLLAENKIDFGIIEGQSKRKYFKYSEFMQDELVLCTRLNNPLSSKQVVSLKDLETLPMVRREQGSGSLQVINTTLKKAGVNIAKMRSEMVLESTESIKAYLMASDSFAFLSVHSIVNELRNKQLSIVGVKNFSAHRNFYFIKQHGDANPLTENLFRFIRSYYLK